MKKILFIFSVFLLAISFVLVLPAPSPIKATSPVPTPVEILEQSEPLTSTNTALPAENIELVNYSGGGPAQGIFVQGDYAYLGLGPALEIVDISDLAQPKRIGQVELRDRGSKVYVAGHYAYVVVTNPFGSDSLVIIDVSDPAKPVKLGSYVPSEGVEDSLFNIWVRGRYVYLHDLSTGLHRVDVTNPSRPIGVGVYNRVNILHDVVIQDHYTYIAAGPEGLRVVDLADPTALVEVGFYIEPDKSIYGIELAGRYLYLETTDSTWIAIDISNPAQPVKVDPGAAIAANPSGADAQPVYNYDLKANGLSIIDISNPITQTQVGFYKTPGYANDLAITPHVVTSTTEKIYAYVTTAESGLRMVDVSNPVAPVEIGAYNPTRFQQGLTIKTEPTPPAGSIYGYTYVAHGLEKGLAVLDLSNPAAPIEVGFQPIPTKGSVAGVTVVGNYAYLTERESTRSGSFVEYRLWIIDVSDPTAPQVVNVITTPGTYTSGLAAVSVSAKSTATGPVLPSSVPVYAYLPTGHMDLRIVEVSNPLAPAERGVHYLPSPPAGTLRDEQIFGDYVVRLYGNKKPAPETVPRGSFEILRRGQLIYARIGGAFEIGRLNPDTNHLVGTGQDITGNGVPDVVISEYTGGELNWYYIFELGETPHLLDVIDDWYGAARFEDLDGDAKVEIVINDWAFYNWLELMDYAESMPQVILRYNGNSYRPAVDLMRQPAPARQQLAALTRQVQTETSWNWGLPPLPVWQKIQDLIYSGHADLAWRFYEELAWPPETPRSEQFMTDFIQTLVYSPYWPEIQAMNAGKWSRWPQHLFPPPAMAPTRSILPTSFKRTEAGLKLAGALDAASMGLEAEAGPLPQSVFVKGTYAYMGLGSTLLILDVTDPAQPVQVGHLTLANLIKTLHVDDASAYIVVGPTEPEWEGLVSGLSVVDVSNPAAPVELSFYQTPFRQSPYETEAVMVANGYAYFVDDQSLHVLDVSDRMAPTRVGFYPGLTGVRSVAVLEDFIYVVDGYDRLVILRFTPPADAPASGGN